jgi:hypothetical protein
MLSADAAKLVEVHMERFTVASSPLEKTVQPRIFAEAHMISRLRRLMTPIFPPGGAKTRHIKRLTACSTGSVN